MSLPALLLRLRDLGVQLWVEDGALRLSASEDQLDESVRAEIREHEAELVQFFGDVGQASAPPPAEIPKAPRDGALPLSFAQQRFWFLLQFEQDASAYNLVYAVRFKGDVDVAAMAWAFDEIERRHELLRTTFRLAGDQPTQVVAPPRGNTLTCLLYTSDAADE